MSSRTVQLDEDAERILEDLVRDTGLSISAVLQRGLLALHDQKAQEPRRTAYEIYKELDLGPGGYAIAPSTETRLGVQEIPPWRRDLDTDYEENAVYRDWKEWRLSGTAAPASGSSSDRVAGEARKPVLVARHLLSILLLPAVVTLAVPYWILSSRPSSLLGSVTASTLAALLAGAAVVGLGLLLVGGTIRRFATEGRGTLAPWDPPRHLVVSGVYRRVRNPMISGVILILFGEALAILSTPLLQWAVGFWVINAIYIPLLEEPMLESRFGDEYREYKAHVPRWVPRRTAWTPPWAEERSQPAAKTP